MRFRELSEIFESKLKVARDFRLAIAKLDVKLKWDKGLWNSVFFILFILLLFRDAPKCRKSEWKYIFHIQHARDHKKYIKTCVSFVECVNVSVASCSWCDVATACVDDGVFFMPRMIIDRLNWMCDDSILVTGKKSFVFWSPSSSSCYRYDITVTVFYSCI